MTKQDDVVDLASNDSFPASDPPGYGSTHASTGETLPAEPVPANEPNATLDATTIALASLSFALGATELLAPRMVAKLVGIRPTATTSLVARLLGAREIASGIALLAFPGQPTPVWARVAGDAMDIAVLAIGATQRRTRRSRSMAGLAMLAGAAAFDLVTALRKRA